ncbi:MAG: hypothetical protein ACLTL8_04205 [Bifidobacterium pseudocatenulatum]
MQGKLSEVSNPNISDAGSKNVTENKKKSRKPAVIAVASVAAVAVLAGGGWFVWKTYANHELAEARQACVEASESYRKAADSYSGLVDGDAATASQITVKQVADAKTVDALAEALKANEPDVVACVADSKADYESKTSLIEKNTGWYGKHEKSLEEAVKAVNDSKLEKTVSDAERLLKNSDGKVADAATRDELSKAVKARDADKIAAASKKVNDSVTAKTKADEEAQRKAEEEAAAQAAAQAQTQQSYSAPQQSYTPSYSGGTSGSTSGGSSSSAPTSFQAAEVRRRAGWQLASRDTLFSTDLDDSSSQGTLRGPFFVSAAFRENVQPDTPETVVA